MTTKHTTKVLIDTLEIRASDPGLHISMVLLFQEIADRLRELDAENAIMKQKLEHTREVAGTAINMLLRMNHISDAARLTKALKRDDFK